MSVSTLETAALKTLPTSTDEVLEDALNEAHTKPRFFVNGDKMLRLRENASQETDYSLERLQVTPNGAVILRHRHPEDENVSAIGHLIQSIMGRIAKFRFTIGTPYTN